MAHHRLAPGLDTRLAVVALLVAFLVLLDEGAGNWIVLALVAGVVTTIKVVWSARRRQAHARAREDLALLTADGTSGAQGPAHASAEPVDRPSPS